MNRGSNWWLKILSAIVVLVLCILLLSHSRDSGFVLSWFNLLVALMSAVAWPVAAVLIVVVLREPIGDILGALRDVIRRGSVGQTEDSATRSPAQPAKIVEN